MNTSVSCGKFVSWFILLPSSSNMKLPSSKSSSSSSSKNLKSPTILSSSKNRVVTSVPLILSLLTPFTIAVAVSTKSFPILSVCVIVWLSKLDVSAVVGVLNTTLINFFVPQSPSDTRNKSLVGKYTSASWSNNNLKNALCPSTVPFLAYSS